MKYKQNNFQKEVQIKNKLFYNHYTPNKSPIKSSFPDRRPANIIAQTQSPSLQDIHKIITPQSHGKEKFTNGVSIYNGNKTPSINKHIEQPQTFVTQQSSKTYKGLYISQASQPIYSGIKISNTEQKQNIIDKPIYKSQQNDELPQLNQFDISKDMRFKGSPIIQKSNEIYIKLLYEKEETIKQLRILLDMINDQQMSSEKNDNNEKMIILQKKIKQYGKQIKILQIQNQCLINVIQNNNNNKNIQSNKQEVLQAHVDQLRQSLQERDRNSLRDLQMFRMKVETYEEQIKKLTNQCNIMIKLLNEQDVKRSKTPSISSHSLVVKDRDKISLNAKQFISKQQSRQNSQQKLFIQKQDNNHHRQSQKTLNKDKQRVTLSKIKDQYHQNLKLIKQNFKNQFQDTVSKQLFSVNQQNKVICTMNHKITDLQQQIKILKQKMQLRQKTYRQIEISQPKPQEIQSIFEQKYKKYIQELACQKDNNERLNLQLNLVNKTLRQYQLKSLINQQDQNKNTPLMIKANNKEIEDRLLKENQQMNSRIRQLQQLIIVYQNSIKVLQVKKYEQIKSIQMKLQTANGLYQAEINKKAKKQEEDNNNINNFRKQIQKAHKQIHMFKMIIQQKEKNCEDLRQQNDYLRNQLQKTFKQQSYNKSLEMQNVQILREYQKLIRQLQEKNQQIKQNKLLIDSLYQSKKQFQNRYTMALSLLNERNNVNIQLQSQLSRKDDRFDSPMKYIYNQTHQIKNNNKSLIDDLIQKDVSKVINRDHDYKTIFKELQQIKQHIFSIGMSSPDNYQSIRNNFSNIEALYQIKLQENKRLLQQISELVYQIHKGQRERNQLKEKIINLQKNIVVYESQLKERKFAYDNILKDKIMMEKSVLMTKKIYFSQIKQKDANHLLLIEKKIDNLLQIEMIRKQNMIAFKQR